jgi:threonylcarbamoyladenosine tRNA methylthiotransferase MtaB
MAFFHVINFGCRASQADGASLKRQLLEAGFEEAAGAQESQIAILNTCTVTARADAEVRQVIRRLQRSNPRCRILVTGCYAQRAPAEIAALPGVAWVVGNSHKHAVAEILKPLVVSAPSPFSPQSSGAQGASASLPVAGPGFLQMQGAAAASHRSESAEVKVGEIGDQFHFVPVFPDDRTRPTLKVQDGCNARCSFCIIPEVRGPSRSLPPERVIEQVHVLEQECYHEIVLSGINLGSYGKDLGRRASFLELLERILAETSIARIRISSIEPMDVSPELIRLVAREPRLAQHFHVPLQSGSDRILRLMNRRYWARQYAERVQAIREQIPDCGIGADVMVGFPGETAQDHRANLRFIESLPFTYLHIFPYSARPGTPAAARSDRLNGRIVRDRAQEIRAVLAAKRRAFLSSQIGRTLSVLTLDETNGGARLTLSTNYLRVALPVSDVAPNVLVNVRVGRVLGDLLYARPIGASTSSLPGVSLTQPPTFP